MGGNLPVQRHQFVSLGTIDGAPSGEFVEALPFTGVRGDEGVQIHGGPSLRLLTAQPDLDGLSRGYSAGVEPNAGALVSGEGVRLALSPAGVGSRTIASIIDVAIQAAVLFLLVLLDLALIGAADDAAAGAVLIVEAVLVIAGYPIVLEWSTRGRTVGKICLGLRVVRDDGGPIAFRHALTRGLASLVLEKPGLAWPLTTIAGLFTISLSRNDKRIGDMLAGTIVLDERATPQPLATPFAWVPVPLQPWVLSLDMHRLDDQLALRLRQFVSRAHAMTPAAQHAIGLDLLQRVLAVTSPPPPPGAPIPALLSSVLAERRRRALAASQPAPQYQRPAPRYQPAPQQTPWARPDAPLDQQNRPPAREPADSPFARPE